MTHERFKSEFNRKKFKLSISPNVLDCTSLTKSWILPPIGLAAIRTVLALFCVTIIIISGISQGGVVWFIYLTNWSYFLLTMSMVSLCLVSLIYVLGKSGNTDNGEMQRHASLQWYQKVAWLFWIIASNASLIVTVLYWALIFTPPTNFMDIAVHTLNTVVMLIELFLGTIPVHILHVVYAMTMAVIYSIFVVVFWAAGGENEHGDPYVYNVLDLENGNRGRVVGILLFVTFVATSLVQLLLYGLYKLRCYVQLKLGYTPWPAVAPESGNTDQELSPV